MSDAENICPRFHHAVELIGGRWTGAIISRLLGGRARYNELRAAIPEISDRMLSERLRALEGEGLLTRTVLPESPVRVEYDLTVKGRALEESIDAIGKWAARWISEAELEHGSANDAPEPRERTGRGGRAASETKRTPRARAAKRR
jgi:DNA-binding HxlR family transcriptional regulator